MSLKDEKVKGEVVDDVSFNRGVDDFPHDRHIWGC